MQDIGGDEDTPDKSKDPNEHDDGSDVEVTDDFDGSLEDVGGEESQQCLSDEDEGWSMSKSSYLYVMILLSVTL